MTGQGREERRGEKLAGMHADFDERLADATEADQKRATTGCVFALLKLILWVGIIVSIVFGWIAGWQSGVIVTAAVVLSLSLAAVAYAEREPIR